MAKTPRTFTHEIDDERSISAPYFEDAANAGFLRKHRNDSELEQMFALAEAALDETNLAVFDTLRQTEMQTFYLAWQKDAGITAGE